MSKLNCLMSGIILFSLSVPSMAVEHIFSTAESPAFLESENDANADDPAIWVHPTDKSRTLVMGTLKGGGLVVMDIHGRVIQRIAAPAAPGVDDEAGRFNNVDLLSGFKLANKAADFAVVSDRGSDKLVIYKIEPTWSASIAPLKNVTAENAPWIFSTNQNEVNDQRTAYGLATQKLNSGIGIGFVTQRERAKIAKVEFIGIGDKITYKVVNNFTFPATFALPNGTTWIPCTDEDGVEPQFEGLVIDKDDGNLYAGQEAVGIWRMGLDGSKSKLIEKVRSYGVPYTRTWDAEEEEFVCHLSDAKGYGGKHLTADVEGLTIYKVPNEDDERYLIASSQGDDSFSIWDIDEKQWEYEGTFALGYEEAGGHLDINEASDGAHIVSANLGADYPLGLLVTQDGNNTPGVVDGDGEEIENTNFKFTSFKSVIDALDLDM